MDPWESVAVVHLLARVVIGGVVLASLGGLVFWVAEMSRARAEARRLAGWRNESRLARERAFGRRRD